MSGAALEAGDLLTSHADGAVRILAVETREIVVCIDGEIAKYDRGEVEIRLTRGAWGHHKPDEFVRSERSPHAWIACDSGAMKPAR